MKNDTNKKSKQKFDFRLPVQVARDFRAAGVNAIMYYSPTGGAKAANIAGNGTPIPVSRISKRFTVLCNVSGEYVTYTSDRYGFRNDDILWDAPKIDWMVVGDSFAGGACVERSDTIASQIQEISGENTISLGLPGNGPLVELGTLKESSNNKPPKMVILLYYEGNDIQDLRAEKKFQH